MGASSRLRMLQYLPLLTNAGLSFDVFPLLDDDYLKRIYSGKKISKFYLMIRFLKRILQLIRLRKEQVLWIEKELFPYFPAIFEKMLNLIGFRLIVDFDDAIFHQYDEHKFSFVRLFLSRKIDRVMQYSDYVVAGNEYLAARAQGAGAKKIEIIPTVIDLKRYSCRMYNEDSNRLVIGWMGSPGSQALLVPFLSGFEKFAKKNCCEFLIVGSNIEHGYSGNLQFVKWSEESEVELIQSMDIGIMPLQNTPWQRGKCGYKLVQYMACGVPVVASNVGVNCEIVNFSQSGYLVDKTEDWELCFKRLMSDSYLRKKLGLNGRRAVEEKYSTESQVPNLVKIFNEAE